jgi:site-specific recombinase, resolvase family
LIKNSCIRTYKIADEKIYLQNIKALSKKKGGFKTIMAVYGYARVSREVQDLTRQLKALSKAGVKVENIFKDIGSGKDFQRIEYQKLVNKILKKGDILYITSVDRLGRDMKGIEEEYRLLTEVRECQIISLEEPFLSTSQDEITNDLLRPILLKFLGWVAERERKELLKRQKQAYNSMSKNSRGKLISNRTGKVIGRPKKYPNLTKAQRDIIEDWINGKRSCLSISKELGISRSTLQRIKEEEYQ